MEKTDPDNGRSREAVWRGALTPDQEQQLEAWMAAHPEEHGAWEEEVALTRLLARLPDAAAPTNLTARILSEVDRQGADADRSRGVSWLGWLKRLGWVPRLAGVAVLVVAGYIGHHQYRVSNQRAELARGAAEVSELAVVVPPVEVLQDFTAIRNLGGAALPDEELLALLQ